MPTPNGPKNQPRFDLNDDPDFPTDLTTVSEYAAKVGNSRVGTASERSALTGNDLWNGLLFFETDTGLTYRYTTAWAIAYYALPRLRMTRPLAGISAGGSFQTVGMTTFAQENGSLFTGSTSFSTPITGRYMAKLVCSTPNSPSGTRRVLGIAPNSAPGSVVAQSPGLGAANDSFSAGIDHTSEVTLQANTLYSVVAASTNALNFSNFDISIRLIAPTTIG